MKAIVLVGGEGTRLRPLTYTTPKQLLPVVEVPMLERVLAHLHDHGIEQAVLSLGYRPDAFTNAYPDGVAGGVALVYAVEPEPLDTAGAIRFAADNASVRETFVVVNGDVLTDVDVSSLVEFHHETGATATIHLTPVDDPSRFGVVPTDTTGRVLEFIEKPAREDAPTNLINAGTYVMEPEAVERIPPGRRVSIEREIFPALAAEGRLYAQASDAYWLDTGTPEAYLQAHFDLLDGRRACPPAPGAREVSKGVWVTGAPELRGEVRAPSFVGARASVGEGAAVRHSVVGARCGVGEGAVVEDSVLLDGVRIGRGARVSGSVLGHEALIGEGCKVEALTVVGDGVRLEELTRLVGARVPAEAPA